MTVSSGSASPASSAMAQYIMTTVERMAAPTPTPVPPPGPGPSGAATGEWGAAQTAVVIAAAIALLGSLALWVLNQQAARRERRSAAFGEALAAVERYMELPFRIRRRRDGHAARHELASLACDIQVDLAHHQGWLDLVAPEAAAAYRELVSAARRDAGTAMSTAWLEKPITTDAEMNLGARFTRERTDAARARCVDAMDRASSPRLRRRRTPACSPDQNAVASRPRP